MIKLLHTTERGLNLWKRFSTYEKSLVRAGTIYLEIVMCVYYMQFPFKLCILVTEAIAKWYFYEQVNGHINISV